MPEQPPMQGVDAVATGSGPVSEAEIFLAAQWEERARIMESEHQETAKMFQVIGAMKNAKVKMLRECAAELRRQVAASNVRQPDPNAEVCNEPPPVK